MSGSGGSGARDGSVPTDCGGTVKFRLVGAGPGSTARFCLGQPGSCVGSSGFLQLFDAEMDGIGMGRSCLHADCAECRLTGCPTICGISQPLTEQGIESEWNGVLWQGGQTCGDNIPCATPSCASRGSYLARFCGHALPADGASTCEEHADRTPTCVDVPFEYPTTETVEAVLDLQRGLL